MRIHSFSQKEIKKIDILINVFAVFAFVIVTLVFVALSVINNVKATSLPSKYDLRDVNGKNLTTPLKNQGDKGLCWAFASVTSFESVALKSGLSDIDNPEIFSPYQIDFALSSDGMKDFKLPFNKIDHVVTDGGQIAYWWMGSGLSPEYLENFDEDRYDSGELPVNEVLKTQEYFVADYDELVSTEEETLQEVIKEHIVKYGAVAVSTDIRPNCTIEYGDDTIYDYSSNCVAYNKPSSENFGHAMTVIGWDDDFEVKYCKDLPSWIDEYDINFNSEWKLANCEHVITERGAWILQNSWGERNAYPYLTYASDADFEGIKIVRKTDDIDTTYTQTSMISSKIEDGTYAAVFQSSDASLCDINGGCEKVVGLNFQNEKNISYQVYLSPTGLEDSFQLVSTVTDEKSGSIWVDLTQNDSVATKVYGDQFAVKIVPESSAGFIEFPYLSVFTENLGLTNEDVTTINVTTKGDTLYKFSNKVGFLVSSHRYPAESSIEDIGIKILNPNGEDITASFKEVNRYNIDDNLFVNYDIKSYLDYEYIVVQVLYDAKDKSNETADALKEFRINTSNLDRISNIGTGTKDDPYVITTAEQLVAIGINKEYLSQNYILGANIDLTDYLVAHNYNMEPIGATLDKSFSGTFDGQGHAIIGFKPSSSFVTEDAGLFYKLGRNAVIKNLVFYDASISGKRAGFVAPFSKAATVENIAVYNSEIRGVLVGSIIGYSSPTGDSTYNNLFSDATIKCQSGSIDGGTIEASCGGLVGFLFLDTMSHSAFNGDIVNMGGTNIGGVAGYSYHNVLNDINVYNYGVWETNGSDLAGVVVGDASADNEIKNIVIEVSEGNDLAAFGSFTRGLLSNVYIIDNDKTFSIFGEQNGAEIKNIVYLSRAEASEIDNYEFLNFDDVWEIVGEVPKLQDINYEYRPNTIGISRKYKINTKDKTISNVRVYENSGKITRKQFMDNFIIFEGTIYQTDGVTEVADDDEFMKSGMLVSSDNGDVYMIAIKGDYCFADTVVDIGDAICMLRRLSNLPIETVPSKIEKYVSDFNEDGILDITDVTILRRALAEFEIEERMVYENK